MSSSEAHAGPVVGPPAVEPAPRGSDWIQRNILAERVLGQPKEPRG